MDMIDRRIALRGFLCLAAATSLGATLAPEAAEAAPLALEKDLAGKLDQLAHQVQAVERRPGRPPPRPPHHRRRHRKRRRWVCWWHRGRRHCGWRW